ncbi:hypothetical protein MAH4_31210 [Sessilibacter sp. MAH4]
MANTKGDYKHKFSSPIVHLPNLPLGTSKYRLHLVEDSGCSGQLFSYHPVGGFYHLNAFSTSAGVA